MVLYIRNKNSKFSNLVIIANTILKIHLNQISNHKF